MTEAINLNKLDTCAHRTASPRCHFCVETSVFKGVVRLCSVDSISGPSSHTPTDPRPLSPGQICLLLTDAPHRQTDTAQENNQQPDMIKYNVSFTTHLLFISHLHPWSSRSLCSYPAVCEFLQTNNLLSIIRAHEAQDAG